MRDFAAMLYLPADNARFLAKAMLLRIPAIILDLEDSVALGRKDEARTAARTFIEANDSPHMARWVRINTLRDSSSDLDLSAVVRPGLDGIVLPKVEADTDLQELDDQLGRLEMARGLAPNSIQTIALIESAKGVSNANEIANTGGRLNTLGFGGADFLADLGLPGEFAPTEMSPTVVHAKVSLVMACRIADLNPPHDNAYLKIHDLDGLAQECRLARALGFRGKHAIHPDQVPVITQAFRPTLSEIEEANAVLARANEEGSLGRGASDVSGTMIDAALVVRAHRILEWAEAAAGQDTSG